MTLKSSKSSYISAPVNRGCSCTDCSLSSPPVCPTLPYKSNVQTVPAIFTGLFKRQWLYPSISIVSLSHKHLLNPCSTVFLEKLTGFQPVKKFPSFYGNRRFITAFTRSPTCPYPEPDQSSPFPHIPLPEDPSQYFLPSTPGSPKWFLSLRF